MTVDSQNETATSETVVLLYQYFYPDDVISARLFSDLGSKIAERKSASVVALPSTRACHDPERSYSRHENWQDVSIRRISRPRWRQASNSGRLGNALFMLIGWTWKALTLPRSKRETMIVGSDPILGVLVAIPWRLFRPRAKIVHWCHDLYPAAAVADGLLTDRSWLVRFLRFLLRFAYRRCDAIVDLGDCMRQRLSQESSGCPTIRTTITPWSLVEPSTLPEQNREVRTQLFGEASLCLLYSGNLGRAHLYDPFVRLASKLQTSNGNACALCFSGRGPKIEQLKLDAAEAENIRFAGFAPEGELEIRLSAADIHLVSLEPGWTGTVVPSKFFGALATGRPVLFAGSENCSIAKWIREFGLGWVLNDTTAARVELELIALATSVPRMQEMKMHCLEVYKSEFSRDVQMQRWKSLLGDLYGSH